VALLLHQSSTVRYKHKRHSIQRRSNHQAMFTLRRCLNTTDAASVWSCSHTRCYAVLGSCELSWAARRPSVSRQPVFKDLNDQEWLAAEASSVSAAEVEGGLAWPHQLRRLVAIKVMKREYCWCRGCDHLGYVALREITSDILERLSGDLELGVVPKFWVCHTLSKLLYSRPWKFKGTDRHKWEGYERNGPK